MHTAERHHVVGRDPELVSKWPEVLFHQVEGEPVVARRHRGVRREDHLAGDAGQRLLERDPFFLHATPDRFEQREPTVTFVQVQHTRRDAHGAQRPETAHAEEQFLPDAHPSVAAVQARHEVTVL